MNSDKTNNKKSNSGLVKLLYVLSVVMFLAFAYMVVANVMYINTYTASYGMAFSDMWAESIQYILTGSISYLVYAFLFLAAAKILKAVSEINIENTVTEEEEVQVEDAKNDAAKDSVEELAKETEAVAEETSEMTKEPMPVSNKNRKQYRRKIKRGYYR